MTEEAEQLRALIREAHETTKDLRLAIRQGVALLPVIQKAGRDAVDEQMREHIAEGLAKYENAIDDAIKHAEQGVYARFTALGDILLAEDKASLRQGRSVRQMIESWVEEGQT